MEGKWFAEDPEDAQAWGRLFYGDEPFQVVRVAVPNGVADQLRYEERLDGIEPARYVDPEQLHEFNQSSAGIEFTGE